MSLYDTEDLMQSSLSYSSKSLIDLEVLRSEVEEAINLLYKLEPVHCKRAFYHNKVSGNSSAQSRADYFLGLDNILEYETINGDTVFVGIDWTENVQKVDFKVNRMATRKPCFDLLGIDICLTVCLTNHVLLRGTKQQVSFLNEAYGLIFEKIDSMIEKGTYTSSLTINMGEIVK